MTHFKEELIFYGDDIKIERFYDDTLMLYAPYTRPAVPDPNATIRHALDHPIGAEPLEKQLNSSSRVLIAFDDPCLPIPLMLKDPRSLIIEEVLRRLHGIGVKKENIRLVCANGLHRKWTLKELSVILGKNIIKDMAPQISCHDATRDDELIHLGDTDSGMEIEINRAVDQADITIYVNLNFTSMNGGWKSIMVGLGSWRSIRHHHNPDFWNGKDSVMDPEHHQMHRVLKEMGAVVKKKYNIFQIESVVNNRTWPWPLDSLLSYINSGRRSSLPGPITRTMFNMASLSPTYIKRIVRNSLRSSYGLLAVNAGNIDLIHPETLKIVDDQQNVKLEEPVDVAILGIPNLSPYSAFSILNPILLRSLVLGYLGGLYRNKPFVKKGGLIVAYNPGIEKFNLMHHPSYKDFWDKDLKDHMDPEKCWNDLAEVYATNPEYVRKYRNEYAYHGTHGLINWIWSGMALRQLNGVILAGAKEPETARKIGFIPSPSFATALSLARDMAGKDARMAYLAIPPLFAIDIE